MATRSPKSTLASDIAFVPVDGSGNIVKGVGAWSMPGGDDIPSDEYFESPTPEVEETAADRVLAMLTSAGQDASAKLSLYRLPANGKKLTWLDDFSPDDFERGGFKMLSEKWGAGEYELRLYGIRETDKRFGVRTRQVFTLESPRVVSSSMPGVNPHQQSELSQVLAMMASQQTQILAALNDKPAPVDPMTQMTQMLTMMKLMREATGDSTPKSPIGDIVSAIRELKDVSGLINPEREDTSPLGMVKDMLPMVQMAMQQRAAQNPPPPITYAPNPVEPKVDQTIVTSESVTSPAIAQPENAEVNPIALLALRGHLKKLIMMAEKNMPTELGADLVYEKVPDELIDLLVSDEWWQLLQMVAPESAVHEKWFDEVRNKALALFGSTEEDAEQATSEKPVS